MPTEMTRARGASGPLVALIGAAMLVGVMGVRGEGAAAGGEVVVRDGRGVVEPSYFGMHIHRAAASAWPSAPFATWRLWDAYVTWPFLQPQRGEWSWDRLDRLVALAEARRVEVLLPLGLTPGWASARPDEYSAYRPGQAAEPADLDDWRRYVEAVVNRYAGRIRLFEIWNEPNLKSFYSGDIDSMVRLCRDAREVIKRADPRNLLVSPSATLAGGPAWLDRFLAAGGTDCFDVVGFHFYVTPDPPEKMLERVAEVRRVMAAHGISDRPLWNTEDGVFIDAKRPRLNGKAPGRVVLGEPQAAAALARSLVLARAAGIERFYWYSWDNEDLGLVEYDGTLKQPARAFTEVHRWLVGAELIECRGARGTWICPLVRGRKQRAWMAWSPGGRRRLTLPSSWRASTSRDLTGRSRSVAGATSTVIGPSPVLIEGAR